MRLNVVGAKPPQPFDVVTHRSLPLGFSSSRKRTLAAVQAGPNGADRNAQSNRDLVIAELFPDVEHQSVAFFVRQPGEGACHLRPELPGVDRRRDDLAHVDRRRPTAEDTAHRPHPAGFAASMVCEQPGRDPVQPRPGLQPPAVVRGASFEGHPEDFAQEGIGLVNPDAAHQIPEQHRRVSVEDDPELLWILDRGRDDCGVRWFPH